MKPVCTFLLLVLVCSAGQRLAAHPGHDHSEADRPRTIAMRSWTSRENSELGQGIFVQKHGVKVQIRRADDSLVDLLFDELSLTDRMWVHRKEAAMRKANPQHSVTAEPSVEILATETIPQWLLAQREANAVGRKDSAPAIAKAFEAFVTSKAIRTRWDERYFYVESQGLPAHRMMVGITAWQQQVPLPQPFTGNNAWQIPLHPVPAQQPVSTKNRFLRGAIALAVNGVPIFNPLNNRGEDSYAIGELDEFGGHCGRGDDYHYHIAPVHLEKINGKGLPIAYALDGYPIYGYEEPDGSPVKKLDACNGHKDAQGNYHYHATKSYPYLNGGFYGEVTEREGQVDPQPRDQPWRPAQSPLRDAKIVGFEETKPGSYLLTYEIRGKQGTVGYTLADNGTVTFVTTDPNGKSATETFTPRKRGPGGPGGEGKRPPPKR